MIILFVAAGHAILVLTGWLFHVEVDYAPFGYARALTQPWLIPVLFVLAGASARYSLQKRSPLHYSKQRIKRLLVPLLFGTLVVVPPQVYVQRLHEGTFDGPYTAFYPHFFSGMWPAGNFTYAHLWFIAYLFAVSFLALPVLLLLSKPRGRRCVDRLAGLSEWPCAILLLIVPLAITGFVLLPVFPCSWALFNDWSMLSWFLCAYIAGYIISNDSRFWRAIERHSWPALVGGVVIALFAGVPRMESWRPSGYSLALVVPITLSACRTWFLAVAVLGLGSKFLRFNSRILPYISEASYPFYILHETIVVVIAYCLLNWNVHILVKFAVILSATIVVTLSIYDLAVRRWPVTRFLLGMNPKRISTGPELAVGHRKTTDEHG